MKIKYINYYEKAWNKIDKLISSFSILLIYKIHLWQTDMSSRRYYLHFVLSLLFCQHQTVDFVLLFFLWIFFSINEWITDICSLLYILYNLVYLNSNRCPFKWNVMIRSGNLNIEIWIYLIDTTISKYL